MITQLLISSSAKSIITASYVIVGGGGGAVFEGANGLGGAVINGEVIIPVGSYSVTIGSGGTQGGGLGSSSTFNNLTANGSTRTTTITINGEIFSGQDAGNPNSSVKGSGALASSMAPIETCIRYKGAMCREWVLSGYTNGVGNNGVVILTIPTALTSTISASGATISYNGSNTIYRFNSSGSLEVL